MTKKNEQSTLESIHKAAKKEFLEKGFQSASLRNIVKTAGVTTGAFYGYYDSKEELFEALVGEQYRTFMGAYKNTMQEFAQMSPEKQMENLGTFSYQCMHDMLLYAYDHLTEFKLLLCCSEGTRFAGMLDEMVEIEIKGTHDYQAVLNSVGKSSPHIDPQLEHILITGMFNTYFELMIHEMPMEQAEIYLSEMWDFYCAGWFKIMGQ